MQPLVGIDLHELIRLKQHVILLPMRALLSCRDWSAWIDTIETNIPRRTIEVTIRVGIDLHELIRLKQIRWWPGVLLFYSRDWSAWIDTIETSSVEIEFKSRSVSSRDWSAWIDTIETYLPHRLHCLHHTGRDWSAWIDTIETCAVEKNSKSHYQWSGLICMNWYDWNFMRIPWIHFLCKLGRDWSAWIDTIETSRMLLYRYQSGWCRDWSAWIDTIETPQIENRTIYKNHLVGIDLHELIRLKLYQQPNLHI